MGLPLIGLLSPTGLDRYVPLGDAVNGNIEIDMYLAPQFQPAVHTDAGTGGFANTTLPSHEHLVGPHAVTRQLPWTPSWKRHTGSEHT